MMDTKMSDALQHAWDLDSVDFPLTEDSVVFEIGGYTGRWAKEIAERYNPLLYVFEPQPWAFDKCKEALSDYTNARVFPFALGLETAKLPMGNWETDGCSFMNAPSGKPVGWGRMREIHTVMRELRVDHINLCLCNIEGYEFELIPHMIRTGIMDSIDYFMCQFHLGSASETEYYDLRRQLSEMNKIRFDYGPTLTCWEPK